MVISLCKYRIISDLGADKMAEFVLRIVKSFLFVVCGGLLLQLNTISAANTPEHLKIKPSASRGIVIDAGSGGSRLHVYSWEPRVFSTSPPPLSFPNGNEKWTARRSPGIAAFSEDINGIAGHLAPLMAFAKDALKDRADQYGDFPIYFYATGGMRQLSSKKRDKIINAVRKFLKNDIQCPFFFKNEFARVISGTSPYFKCALLLHQ